MVTTPIPECVVKVWPQLRLQPHGFSRPTPETKSISLHSNAVGRSPKRVCAKKNVWFLRRKPTSTSAPGGPILSGPQEGFLSSPLIHSAKFANFQQPHRIVLRKWWWWRRKMVHFLNIINRYTLEVPAGHAKTISSLRTKQLCVSIWFIQLESITIYVWF